MNEMSCMCNDIMQIILRKTNGEVTKQNVHSIYAIPIPSCNCINKLIPLIISLIYMVYMTNNTGTLVNLIIFRDKRFLFCFMYFATLLFFNISYINYIKNLKYIKMNKNIY